MTANVISSELRTIVEFLQTEAPALKVTPDMIKNPTADNVLRVYYFLCDLLFDFGGREMFDSKNEVYGRALTIIRVHDHVGLISDVFGPACEVPFSYTDLLLPDGDKTRFFLVNLIRFYRFKCERQREIDGVLEELDNMRRDVEAERAFEANSQGQLERDRETQEVMRNQKLELTTKLGELDKEFRSIEEEKDENKQEFDFKNERFRDQRAKIEDLQAQITEAEAKAKRLEMNIVSSPDRIVHDIESMEIELDGLHKKQTQVTQDCRKLERDLGNQSLAKQIVDHFVSELQQLEHYQDELSEYRRAVDQKAQDLKNMDTRLDGANQELIGMKTECETRLRHLEDSQQNDQRNIGLLIQEKGHLESDLKELSERVKTAKGDMRSVQIELKKKEKALVTVGEEMGVALDDLKYKHSQIEDRVAKEEKLVEDMLAEPMKIFKKNFS